MLSSGYRIFIPICLPPDDAFVSCMLVACKASLTSAITECKLFSNVTFGKTSIYWNYSAANESQIYSKQLQLL